MIACADALVNPRAVMIITFNASLTNIAMVTPWYGNDFALEAEFVYFEMFQKF